MSAIQDTAYPRLKQEISLQELDAFYTPSQAELVFALAHTQELANRAYLLLSLKCFQRLGYFIPNSQIPPKIVNHIGQKLGLSISLKELQAYERSRSRKRHHELVRAYLGVKAFTEEAQQLLETVLAQAARVKNEDADLINIAIEELLHYRYELPAFKELRRLVIHLRYQIYEQLYEEIAEALGEAKRQQIDTISEKEEDYQSWNQIKADPGRPTLGEFKIWTNRYEWMKAFGIGAEVRHLLSEAKLEAFGAEALSLDGAQLRELRPAKRYCVVACGIAVQLAQALDDVAEIFIKRLLKLHQKAKEAQAQYRQETQSESDELIGILLEVLSLYQGQSGTIGELMSGLNRSLGQQGAALRSACEQHIAKSNQPYYSFLLGLYGSHRKTLFQFLDSIPIRFAEASLEQAFTFMQAQRENRAEWLPILAYQPDGSIQRLLNLDWIGEGWWSFVTGQAKPEAVVEAIHHRYFEISLFSEIVWGLKSGDVYLEGSDAYGDFTAQLITWDEYHEQLPAYSDEVGFPVEAAAFVAHVQAEQMLIAEAVDAAFPENSKLSFEAGRPKLERTAARTKPRGWRAWQKQIRTGLEPLNIMDALVDVEQWLGITGFFGPISGAAPRIEEAQMRYLISIFCYGCNLGPSQTARLFKDIHRLQIARIDKRHITEEKLEQAIEIVINAFNRFLLPRYWGKGDSASADGTKWNVYENNLMAEYHIRYGGYGGIGYYHVADSYIALFSRFIPCGVYEAVHILDGLLENESDIQPDILHADTHGQSEVVFGLAYLLGIRLMPRIRGWKDLNFYRAKAHLHYQHIDSLFSGTTNWPLVVEQLPHMLRVVLSIRSGRISSSAILRRLSSYSRKNALYRAFRELGRAVRTGFLLNYISQEELRQMITAGTNRSESFNKFIKWLSFGGQVISRNNREAQRKIIKYNHLVANCLIFHNVVDLSQALHQALSSENPPTAQLIATLSPYQTEHVNRFGSYNLDLQRPVTELNYQLPISISAQVQG